MTHRYETTVYVAAHQFYIKDSAVEWNGAYSNDPWAVPGDGPGVAPGVIGLQTSRAAAHAPVFVEVLSAAPSEPAEVFHKVVEASIEVSSGILHIHGEDNNETSGPLAVTLPNGTYRVRVLYSDLDTVTYDDDDGAEHYVVQIFPGEARDPAIVRSYDALDDEPVRTSDADRAALEPDLVRTLSSDAESGRSAQARALVELARLGATEVVANAARSHASRALRLHAVNALRLVNARAELETFAKSEDRAIRGNVEHALDRD